MSTLSLVGLLLLIIGVVTVSSSMIFSVLNMRKFFNNEGMMSDEKLIGKCASRHLLLMLGIILGGTSMFFSLICFVLRLCLR